MVARLNRFSGHRRRIDPVMVDVAIAAVLLLAEQGAIWTDPSQQYQLATSLLSLGPIVVAVRRRWLFPAAVVAALNATVKAFIFDGHADRQGGLPGLITAVLIFYGIGAFLDGWRTWVTLAIGLYVVWLGALTGPLGSTSTVSIAGNVVTTVILVVLPVLGGRVVRRRQATVRAERERTERLDLERESRVRSAAAAERARLAREIHDVIAHSVSVMVIQAGGARTVLEAAPDRAETALGSVEQAGREALAEMRRLLGILDAGDRHELAPQPGLDDLPELVARTEAAGVPASILIEGEPVPVPPGVSLCAYRVIQEALTNTIRHAGPARARIAVRWREDALELEVADDGRGDVTPDLPTGGHGLAGMRERAALHGGRLEAGPEHGGGFAVRAWIPLEDPVL